MSVPFVPYNAEAHLDWIALTDALAAGHDRPRAEIGDSFLYRRDDTMLTRSAWIDGLGLAVKTATLFPGNAAHGKPAINGAVALYSDGDGTIEALLDFHLVTKWKTAADSLLAARRLARPDSKTILICGAGTVARSLTEAYRAAFPDAHIAIWNRSRDRAESLARETGTSLAADLAATAPHADIIACATMTPEPILLGNWLRPGQHVDLIGAYRPDLREADDEVLRRGKIFVDSRETTLHHIGEMKIPLERGVITEADILADFYELDRFARAPEDITVFKNGGGAHLDLMTSRHILERWRAAQG